MFNSSFKKISSFVNSIFSKSNNHFYRRRKSKKKLFIIIFLVLFLILVVLALFIFKQKDEPLRISIEDNKNDCLQLSNMDWCESSQECFKADNYFCPDELNLLISDIETNAGLKFVSSGPSTFSWSLDPSKNEISEKIVKGFVYESNLSLNQVGQLEDYLERKAFFDPFNVADGVAGGLKGYYYKDFVCIMDFRYKEMKNNGSIMVPVKDLLSVKLKCGPLLK